MYRRHTIGLGGIALPALEGPDTGSGGTPASTPGGDAPPADAGADAPADSADPGATAAAPGAADADEDDLDDDGADDVAQHLPEPQVRTRARRLQRQMARMRPIVERFRDPATGKTMTPDQVDRLLANARDFDAIDRVFQGSPELMTRFMQERDRIASGQPAPSSSRPAAAPTEPADAPFDESTWPFETDTPTGQRLLQMAKDQHELTRQFRATQRELTAIKQGTEQQTLSQTEQAWKRDTLAAAAEVAPEYRELFIRGVYYQFELLKSRNQLGAATPKSVTPTRRLQRTQPDAPARRTHRPARRRFRPDLLGPAVQGGLHEHPDHEHAERREPDSAVHDDRRVSEGWQGRRRSCR
jgi:hypothetical protein